VLNRTQAAEDLHVRKADEVRSLLGGFSLAGIRVYISLSAANAFGVLDLVEELGGEIAGVTVTHLDRLHTHHLKELAARNPTLQIHVSDGQAFEELSILRKISPDLYLGDSAHIGQVARLGFPIVSLETIGIIGYSGVIRLVQRVRSALNNRSFVGTLSGAKLPFHEAWYRRSHNWHIKQEVK